MLRQTWTVFAKDLKVDFRRMENFLSTFFFSLVILTIIKFALGPDPKVAATVAPGIYWITFLLGSVISLNKTFQLEKENACMEALVLSPVNRSSLYLGKFLGCSFFILIVQACVLPLFGLFFYEKALTHLPELGLVCLLATIGFSSLGTLLASITASLRFHEILLPLLLFPLIVPLLLASVKITDSIFSMGGLLGESDWLKLLLAFDFNYLLASAIAFEYIMDP